MHLYYKNSPNLERKYIDFPNRANTNVFAFRDFVYEITLNNREKITQAFLNKIDTFLTSLQLWIMEEYSESKMAADLRAV
jgi:DNA-binding cell septation regulator SpoVG